MANDTLRKTGSRKDEGQIFEIRDQPENADLFVNSKR
jgi:hypothetical protein